MGLHAWIARCMESAIMCCQKATHNACRLRLFDLPPDIETSSDADGWAADVRIAEGETIYDYAWYPLRIG